MAKRLYIVFHGRFPSEKAAALYAALHAKSFVPHMPVVLLVPRRLGRNISAHEYYRLPASIKVVYLPTIDLFSTRLRGIAFPVSYAVFSCAAFLYLFFHVRKVDTIDTNEALPALLATGISGRVIYEVHDFPERFLWFYRLLFLQARYILATNKWKKAELKKRFGILGEKIIMERNGVDLEQFASSDRAEARKALGLSPDARIAVYTGHLYSWKGVDILAQAAKEHADIEVYLVGGTSVDVTRFKKQYGGVNTLHILGHRPHDEVPMWLAAADVLVLPNTAQEEISAHYTSPMKLFEYMASGRPIVASDIPSIREVLPDELGFLVPPDDPSAMAHAIARACTDATEASYRAARARARVEQYSWQNRAQRLRTYFT